MRTPPLRLGLVGCGRIMEQGHAPALERIPEIWRVSSVSDPNLDRRTLLGDRFEVPETARFDNLTELLRSDVADAIDIAVPHSFHTDMCIEAAQAGMPFLSEKPLATSLPDAEKVIAAVKQYKGIAGIMHNYVNQPRFIAARNAIEKGRIGTPFLFRMEAMASRWYSGTEAYDPHWRSRMSTAGGGALLDNGYHNLYAAESILQSPATEIFARVGTHVQEQDVDDTAVVVLGHASRATSMVLAAWSAASAAGVNEVHGTHGSIRLNGDAPVLHTHDKSELLNVPRDADTYGFEPIFSSFAQTIVDGRPPLHTLADGYRNLQIVMAAYDSADKARMVRLTH